MTAQAKATEGVYNALLKVQEAVDALPKDASNPRFGSFTSLKQVVETVGSHLTENQLVWTTRPRRNPETGFPELAYQLKHVPSGETIEDAMPLLLAQEDMQALGSAITYARRYTLQSVLNLVSEDDDGNDSSTPRNGQARASQPAMPAATKGITEPQKKRLAKALRDSHTTTAAQIKAAAKQIIGREIGAKELEQLTSREASKFIEGLDAGVLPDPENPSDIPDEQESFDVPAGAVGTDSEGQPF